MAVPCTDALTVVCSNLSLSAVTAVSVLPAVSSIPLTGLPPCPLSLLTFLTDTVSSPSLKSFALSFCRIGNSLTVFFLLFAVLFQECSLKTINPNVLLPDLSASSTPLGEILNGIHTSIVLFLKVASVIQVSGVLSNTSTINFYANPSRLPF